MITSNNNIKTNSSHNLNSSFYTCIILFILILTIFAPATGYEFIHYDDPLYVTENTMVQKGLAKESISWAFTNISAGFWFPLTWLSHMLDYDLYKMNAGGHHLTSIIIHSINTFLLFYLIRILTGAFWQSLFVAIIFGLHPLHVEPVVWISSRKDVLYTFFYLISLICYYQYTIKGGVRQYCLVLTFFILGMMAKPMIISLPLVLLLIDFWPLDRLGILDRNIKNSRTIKEKLIIFMEKIPFLFISLAFILITFIAEKKYGALPTLEHLPVGVRITNIFSRYLEYILKSIYPVDLSITYYREDSQSIWIIFLSICIITAVSVTAVRLYRKKPYFIFGWAWFILTLIPVIGFIQIGSHSIADRYTYIPLTGISIIAAWGLKDVFEKYTQKKYHCIAFFCILTVLLGGMLHHQLGYWKDSITLFEHASVVSGDNPIAQYNLGLAYANHGRAMDSLPYLVKSLKNHPSPADVIKKIASVYSDLGQYENAISNYRLLLDMEPDNEDINMRVGFIYGKMGKSTLAIERYRHVIEIYPNNEVAHNNLATVLISQEHFEEARSHLIEALEINPGYLYARRNLKRIENKKDIPLSEDIF